ncbi:MAG: YfhO family protein [Bacteroidales bacterium]|nr:YfhO family protein [Bacteroidales bacterium]
MKPILKKTLIHGGIIVFFFLIAAIYMSPAFDGKVIQQGDILKWQAMAKEQQDFQKATGEYTTWTSSMFSGMPSYQVTAPPTNSLFTKIQHFLNLHALDLSGSVGVVLLYLLGFYVALLAIGLSPWLSLLGALAFGLGSYNIIIIEAGHITKAYAMTMMAPIIGGMLLVLCRKKYLWGGILFALALGVQISCNHIQITYYTMLVGIILGIVYLIYAIKDKELKHFFVSVGILLVGCVFAIGGNARQLFINQEYVKYTMRGGSEISVTPEDLYKDSEPKSIAASNGLDMDYAYSWSYGKGETYTLLVPGAYGGGSGETVGTDSEFYKNFRQKQAPLYWGDQPFTSGPVYFGAIVIFLFVLGLFVVKGPERWWILIATILAIMMSWGKNLMGFNSFLFDHLPLYNKFRTPSMSLVIANVTMVLMAILALKAVFNKENPVDKKKLNLGLYISTGITAGFILLMMAFSGNMSFSGASDTQMAAQYGDQWSMIQDVLVKDRKALFMSDSWRSLILILISAVCLWLYINEKIKQSGIIIGILSCLVLFDLWGVDRRYLNDTDFITEKRVKLKPTPTDQMLDQYAAQFKDEDYRVFDLSVNTFNDSYPSAFHHQIGGYSAAKLRRYQDIIDFYLSRHINTNVLNMLNARYVVVPGQNNQSQVQRNPDALGNAWFVDQYQLVEDPNAEILALNELNPADTAIIDKRFAEKVQGKHLERDSNSVITMEHQKPYNPDYVVYKTKTSKEQLAVFSEVYYEPDWKAYIDGKPAEYFRANYILRAMVVPAGEHKIEFRNEAPLMHKLDKITLIFSILFVLVLAGSLFFYYRGKKKGETPDTVEAKVVDSSK